METLSTTKINSNNNYSFTLNGLVDSTKITDQKQDYSKTIDTSVFDADYTVSLSFEAEMDANWGDEALHSALDIVFEKFNAVFANSDPTLSDFGILDAYVDSSYLDYVANSKPTKPPEQEAQKIIVTASRPRGSGIGLGMIGLAAGTTRSQGKSDADYLKEIKKNIKDIFPGVTDEELNKLLDQIKANPITVARAAFNQPEWKTIGSGNTKKIVPSFTLGQANFWRNTVKGLNTPEGQKALDLFNQGVKNGDILIRNPKFGR